MNRILFQNIFQYFQRVGELGEQKELDELLDFLSQQETMKKIIADWRLEQKINAEKVEVSKLPFAEMSDKHYQLLIEKHKEGLIEFLRKNG